MKKLISKIDNIFGLIGCSIGYGFCAVISLAGFAFTWFALPELAPAWFFLYAVLFVPFVFFSAMLTRMLIKKTKARNRARNLIFKPVAVLIIWFITFFPFSVFGVQGLLNIPAQIAKNSEISEFREEIMRSETYADLTPLGLGVYKQTIAGDRYLWDITQPKDRVHSFEGTPVVFENYFNHRQGESWDYRNSGTDVNYDVYYYNGTYIIVPPQSTSLYLCKEINDTDDLYAVFPVDAEAVSKLRELPGERFAREIIVEKLGKTY